MATVKVKIFYGPNYDRCKVVNFIRETFTAMMFKKFSSEVRQTMGYENSSRIQYRDDEQTFVTMNSDEDFEDAVRCICPVMNSENIYRLCIRVDDSMTPKTTATKQSVATTLDSHSTVSTSSSSCSSSMSASRKRKLEFPFSSKSESKPAKSHSQAETPLQRYISNTKRNIEEKMQAKASRRGGRHNGKNRHIKTAKSSREEKLHPAENSRQKQMRQSISKLENEIRQLNKELENRQAAVDKVNSSKTNRIEIELLEADDDYTYTQNGVRNWRLLRKHVYAIGYCKKNMNGKIPPKHELKHVLDLALNDENPELDCKISQHRTHRQNPCKNVLENNGIVFPESSDNCKAYDSNASNSTVRYMPLMREEEEEQLKIALSVSARSCSSGIHAESYFDPQGKQNSFLISPPTAPYFCYPLPSIPANHINNFEAPNPYFYNYPPQHWQMQPAIAIETSTSTITSNEGDTSADNQEETDAASVLMALSGNNVPFTD
ncbi:hypothetical protein AC249_AIPGENE7676 [Paramuricea clavata]|uniref:Uncharacterized protein n=1 Tax=Paramuricea clavata TaxID=317549 RepID=A0A7D9E207_PARCT|nr:hypothetical protein AC249_AIPGENE7676 [Paramuricea clavata]